MSLYTPTRTLDIEFIFKSLYEIVVKYFEVLAKRNNPEGKSAEEVVVEESAGAAEGKAEGEEGKSEGKAGAAEDADDGSNTSN